MRPLRPVSVTLTCLTLLGCGVSESPPPPGAQAKALEPEPSGQPDVESSGEPDPAELERVRRKLNRSAHTVQHAFNTARRAAITLRKEQFPVFFRGEDALGRVRHGLQLYRKGAGYDGEPLWLESGVRFATVDESAPVGSTTPPFTRLAGLGAPLFDKAPQADNPSLFNALNPLLDAGVGWITILKDGTCTFSDPLVDRQPPLNGPLAGLYDLGQALELTADRLELMPHVDLTLYDRGGRSPARCYLGIDPNSGRVRFRLVD